MHSGTSHYCVYSAECPKFESIEHLSPEKILMWNRYRLWFILFQKFLMLFNGVLFANPEYTLEGLKVYSFQDVMHAIANNKTKLRWMKCLHNVSVFNINPSCLDLTYSFLKISIRQALLLLNWGLIVPISFSLDASLHSFPQNKLIK